MDLFLFFSLVLYPVLNKIYNHILLFIKILPFFLKSLIQIINCIAIFYFLYVLEIIKTSKSKKNIIMRVAGSQNFILEKISCDFVV